MGLNLNSENLNYKNRNVKNTRWTQAMEASRKRCRKNVNMHAPQKTAQERKATLLSLLLYRVISFSHSQTSTQNNKSWTVDSFSRIRAEKYKSSPTGTGDLKKLLTQNAVSLSRDLTDIKKKEKRTARASIQRMQTVQSSFKKKKSACRAWAQIKWHVHWQKWVRKSLLQHDKKLPPIRRQLQGLSRKAVHWHCTAVELLSSRSHHI